MKKAANGILLAHGIIVRSPSLLPMKYKLTELAEELGTSRRTLETWLPKGLPHTRDAKDNIWVVGTQFAEWIAQQHRISHQKAKLREDQAYCLKCRTAVQLVSPIKTNVRGKLILIKGRCSNCGTEINRGGRLHD
jgi:plasmid maintenance system antidote protein VapI